MRPEFRVIADSKDITAAVKDRLLSLRITDEAGFKSDLASLALDNRDGKVAIPRTGVELEILLGYKETGLVRMGVFKVDGVSVTGPPDALSISARAADMMSGLKARRTRSWDDTTLGDLVRTVAQEHGSGARVNADLDRVSLPHVDQTEESDMQLLTRLARDNGAVFKPAGGNLVLAPRGEAKSASGAAMPLVQLARKDLVSWTMQAADRGKYQGVAAYWHDHDGAERTAVTVGSGEKLFTLPGTYPDADAATRAAQAKLDAFQRGTATLDLTLVGRPSLGAESRVSVTGVPGIVGEWIVATAQHTLDGQGLRTELQAETPKGAA